jgi:Zn-dependent M16 (insulinase) family peptidase
MYKQSDIKNKKAMRKEQKKINKMLAIRELKKQKSCQKLVNKLKYLLTHIINQNKIFICEIGKRFPQRYKSYCVQQECIDFMNEHNNKNSSVKFKLSKYGDYVGYLDTEIDLNRGSIMYVLI